MGVRGFGKSRFMNVGLSRASMFISVLIVSAAATMPVAAKDTSKAYEQSRTALFDWERQMPTVEQVNADTARFFDSRKQATDRAAAFSVLLDAVSVYAGEEGAWYVEPASVTEKSAGYAQAIGEAFKNACPPPAPCVSIYDDAEKLRGDSGYKYKVLSRYFAPEYLAAAHAVAPPLLSFPDIPGFWYLFAAGVFLFGLTWWLAMRRRKAPDPAPPLTENYGSAAWAAHRLKPYSDKDVAQGVTFGKSSSPGLPAKAPGAPVTSLPETHTLIVARTRAGKGTRVIVPTLLRYGGSMLVIDPKGENAAITARTRRDQLGQTVHIVNPWGEMENLYKSLGFASATFNPLDALDRDDPNAVAFAQSLAAIICPPATGKEQYWQGSAANVLAGVFLWIADAPGEQKTLARARQLATMSRADFLQVLVKMATSTAYQGAVSEMVSQYVDLAPETYSGIMSNLAEQTKFLSDPQIKLSTASSSFSMKMLREEPTTVYVVIPHDRIQTHATWLRLVIAAAMQGMKSRRAEIPPRHRCMFLIDEFGSIGRIDDIPRDIALMSGYGLDFTLIVQGLDQLKDHYGDARGTILSNCAFKWFCFVNELDTAKYLSESLGKATVRTVGSSASSGRGSGGATAGESTTYGEVGRPLLTPDEILNLGRETAILLNPQGLPHYLRPVDYWKLSGAYAHLREEYPGFYWEPALLYDENPYFKDASTPGRMSRREALNILGLREDASDDAIETRYRATAKQLQPGDDEIARKLNEAKAVLSM